MLLSYATKWNWLTNNDVRTTIAHFVISTNLSDCKNKHCIIEDVVNRPDHVPLCIDITMPISLKNIDFLFLIFFI